MKKLAIITTHPIQYNAPWFKLMTERNIIQVKVFYTWSQSEKGPKYDPGFGRTIQWDIPLLEGYEYEFIENVSRKPGTRSFGGIDNPSLIKKISDYHPDAILVNGWKFKSHLKCIKYFRSKIPVIFRGDSTLMDNRGIFKNIARRAALKRVFKNIDIACYVGIQNKRYFLKHGIKEERLFFVPHAIDNSRFEKQSANHAEIAKLRTQAGIGSDDVVFLFAGKIEPKKDPELVLKAAETFTNDIHLVMVGNGELEVALREKYREFKNIHFMDFRNQLMMPLIYGMADVFVLPSKGPGETWGLAVNEAMACSKPVIVSDMCGCAEDLVEDGINGYIFSSGDYKDLRNKMYHMHSEKVKMKKMGNASKEKIGDFSFESIASRIETIVNDNLHKLGNTL